MIKIFWHLVKYYIFLTWLIQTKEGNTIHPFQYWTHTNLDQITYNYKDKMVHKNIIENKDYLQQPKTLKIDSSDILNPQKYSEIPWREHLLSIYLLLQKFAGKTTRQNMQTGHNWVHKMQHLSFNEFMHVITHSMYILVVPIGSVLSITICLSANVQTSHLLVATMTNFIFILFQINGNFSTMLSYEMKLITRGEFADKFYWPDARFLVNFFAALDCCWTSGSSFN